MGIFIARQVVCGKSSKSYHKNVYRIYNYKLLKSLALKRRVILRIDRGAINGVKGGGGGRLMASGMYVYCIIIISITPAG